MYKVFNEWETALKHLKHAYSDVSLSTFSKLESMILILIILKAGRDRLEEKLNFKTIFGIKINKFVYIVIFYFLFLLRCRGGKNMLPPGPKFSKCAHADKVP